MLLGGVLALLVALCAAAGYVYFRNDIATQQTARSSRVVVVAASPTADGSTAANLIVEVLPGRSSDISPDTPVTIPDTSFTRLGDAYAFAGASGVAEAVPSTAPAGPTGWVDLPAASWQGLLDRSGGVAITLPTSVRVFDGAQLTTFPAGTRTLNGAEVATLLVGSAYLPEDLRTAIRADIERVLLRALTSESGVETLIHTNLGADDLKGWLARLSQAPLESSGTVVP